MVALRDGQPDHALVLVEGGALKGVRCLKAVFALPAHAVTGDVHVEHAAVATVDLGVLLPAQIVNAGKAVEGGLPAAR